MPKTRGGMHREEIKAAIRMRGTTLEALSAKHGYSVRAVGLTLVRPWPAVEKIIAEFIGKPPQEIWPERYDAMGLPNRQRRGKVSTWRRGGNVRNEGDR
jgi:Ner family transcriptional regulator